jgi:hypothetical protein
MRNAGKERGTYPSFVFLALTIFANALAAFSCVFFNVLAYQYLILRWQEQNYQAATMTRNTKAF